MRLSYYRAKRELDSAVLTNRATDIDAATIDMYVRCLFGTRSANALSYCRINKLAVSLLNTGDENNIPLPYGQCLFGMRNANVLLQGEATTCASSWISPVRKPL